MHRKHGSVGTFLSSKKVQTVDTADGSSNPNPPVLNWGKEALGIAGYVWKHFCRIYRDPDLGFQGAS